MIVSVALRMLSRQVCPANLSFRTERADFSFIREANIGPRSEESLFGFNSSDFARKAQFAVAVSLGHLHAYQTISEVQTTSIATKNR